jgi:hypothetical protein
MFSETCDKTLEMETSFHCTMLYNDGPGTPTISNLEKHLLKKSSLTRIRPFQNGESVGFA